MATLATYAYQQLFDNHNKSQQKHSDKADFDQSHKEIFCKDGPQIIIEQRDFQQQKYQSQQQQQKFHLQRKSEEAKNQRFSSKTIGFMNKAANQNSNNEVHYEWRIRKCEIDYDPNIMKLDQFYRLFQYQAISDKKNRQLKKVNQHTIRSQRGQQSTKRFYQRSQSAPINQKINHNAEEDLNTEDTFKKLLSRFSLKKSVLLQYKKVDSQGNQVFDNELDRIAQSISISNRQNKLTPNPVISNHSGKNRQNTQNSNKKRFQSKSNNKKSKNTQVVYKDLKYFYIDTFVAIYSNLLIQAKLSAFTEKPQDIPPSVRKDFEQLISQQEYEQEKNLGGQSNYQNILSNVQSREHSPRYAREPSKLNTSIKKATSNLQNQHRIKNQNQTFSLDKTFQTKVRPNSNYRRIPTQIRLQEGQYVNFTKLEQMFYIFNLKRLVSGLRWFYVKGFEGKSIMGELIKTTSDINSIVLKSRFQQNQSPNFKASFAFQRRTTLKNKQMSEHRNKHSSLYDRNKMKIVIKSERQLIEEDQEKQNISSHSHSKRLDDEEYEFNVESVQNQGEKLLNQEEKKSHYQEQNYLNEEIKQIKKEEKEQEHFQQKLTRQQPLNSDRGYQQTKKFNLQAPKTERMNNSITNFKIKSKQQPRFGQTSSAWGETSNSSRTPSMRKGNAGLRDTQNFQQLQQKRISALQDVYQSSKDKALHRGAKKK